MCSSDEADGAVLRSGTLALQMNPVCLQVPLTEAGTCSLSVSVCQKRTVSRRTLQPSRVQMPCASLNWVDSISVTLCFIFGHEDNHWAVVLLSVFLFSSFHGGRADSHAGGKGYHGQFVLEEFQQWRKELHRWVYSSAAQGSRALPFIQGSGTSAWRMLPQPVSSDYRVGTEGKAKPV